MPEARVTPDKRDYRQLRLRTCRKPDFSGSRSESLFQGSSISPRGRRILQRIVPWRSDSTQRFDSKHARKTGFFDNYADCFLTPRGGVRRLPAPPTAIAVSWIERRSQPLRLTTAEARGTCMCRQGLPFAGDKGAPCNSSPRRSVDSSRPSRHNLRIGLLQNRRHPFLP